MKVNGDVGSIKKSMIAEIEGLYQTEMAKEDLLPENIAVKMAGITEYLNRELAIFINRKGQVVDVSVGDHSTVALPEIEGRRNQNRLSGIRCIHTHPGGDGRLSAVDISSLLNLKLDAMIALGVNHGKVNEVYVGLPLMDGQGEFNQSEVHGPYRFDDGELNDLFAGVKDRDRAWSQSMAIQDNEERAILIGLETSRSRGGLGIGVERSLEELQELSLTAGVVVLQKVSQKRASIDSAYYVGRGIIEQLTLLRQALNANVLIFDDELSGAQVRNIEEIVGIKVIDRTTLILDIFAQRAKSKEGKLQVELAQLKYRLPRLIGHGGELSRLGGGIGTRGPGEKKLEVDRRHIRKRISILENELKNISVRRGLARESRRKNHVPVVALVGYTNVGKSTLMNVLCGAEVFVENKLFATLDPTTRKLALPDQKEALLIDTVGFISKLPHELVEAFKSTLEEVVYADVLMHVVDASNEELEEQMRVVHQILESLEVMNKPRILVLNKMDQVKGQARIPVAFASEQAYEVSAATGEGLERLLQGIVEAISSEEVELDILVPYADGGILSYIHDTGRILEKEFTEEGTKIKVVMDVSKMDKIKQYVY